ncbi:hypothetical protein D9M69_571200 [compost metagenome]
MDRQRPPLAFIAEVHVDDGGVGPLPVGADLVVGGAVGGHRVARLQLGEVHRLAAEGAGGQGVAELAPAHAVAEAEHADLADEALQRVLVLVHREAEQDAGEFGVHVTADAEGVQQVVLAGEPGQHARLDVRRVRDVDQLVAGDAGELDRAFEG